MKPLFKRLEYALVILVTVVGILVVLDIIFRFNIGDIVFSPEFALIGFVLSFLIAPLAMKKHKSNE